MQPVLPPHIPMQNLDNFPVERARMELKAEMSTLKYALEQQAMQDQLSQDLVVWNRKFLKALQFLEGDLESTVQAYIGHLQHLLSTPLPPYYAPFDMRPLLGSDGRTYGSKALHVYRSGEGVFLNRSPVAQEDETPFYVKPHPIALVFVEWLNKHHALQSSLEVQQRFNELLYAGQLKPLPVEVIPQDVPPINHAQASADAQMARMMARRQRRLNEQPQPGLQNLAELQALNVQIQEALQQQEQAAEEGQQRRLHLIDGQGQRQRLQIEAAQNQMAALQQGVGELQQQNALNRERIEFIAQPVDQQALDNRRAARSLQNFQGNVRQRQELVHLVEALKRLPNPVQQALAPVQIDLAEQFLARQQRVEAVEDNAKEMVKQLQKEILESKAVELNREIKQLEQRNLVLREKQQGLQVRLHAVEMANIKIELQLNQLEKAKKERERKQIGGLVKTLLTIGACAIATWGVSSIINGATLSPYGAGVNGLRLTFPI